ncbi:acetyoacetyl CoA reductase [Legionella lansingensis]|uniref:Acetyoacetyl CoA reductase n=1 Tax=Legionella lansingensis TaxID=45067 RepID=A0A0W0VKE9_9GAMM|nr:SDR family oxidoreductase [Legionella lansingensis]KTD20294.1 acetyoacetyl CoA reductase [Legionella lansingensis]SNV50344.1 acetyoacetyl CoA reductase [Legionella lansingensis]
MRLKNKLAIITGGNSGIGYAVAELFLREGAKIAITGRDKKKIRAAQDKWGPKALCCQTDVTELQALEIFFEKVQKHFAQGIDILVANAGISQETPLKDTTEESFNKIISINVNGVFFTVQKALPYLKKGSSIILVASLAAKQGIKNFSAYCASKAAVLSLAKCLAAELVSENIRVNSISPGVVNTPILHGLQLSEDNLKNWSASIPLKRFAKAEEIAQSMLFLASEESSYLTGADLAVDGGLSGIGSL